MEKNNLEKLTNTLEKMFKFFSEKKVEKFEAIKIKDGDSLIEYSALEVGADVSISTNAGSEVAPDGKYSLVNDVDFTVKDGKIESVENTGDVAPAEEEAPKEELADAPKEGEASDEAPVEAEAPKEDEAVKALTDRVNTLEETIKNLMDSINAVPSKEDVSELKSELKEAYSKIQELSKIPTQLSADNRVGVKDSIMDKYNKIAAQYSK
jgi:ElaB/YqjD/DUF883 family membrane-anchored ribosome-binding protein